MPQPNTKIYANRSEQQRAYRQRVKQRHNNAGQSSAAATQIQNLHASIEAAKGAGDALATAVYDASASATIEKLAGRFFRASIGGAG